MRGLGIRFGSGGWGRNRPTSHRYEASSTLSSASTSAPMTNSPTTRANSTLIVMSDSAPLLRAQCLRGYGPGAVRGSAPGPGAGLIRPQFL